MEFPLAVYSPNGTEPIHGHNLGYKVVNDQGELDDALANGWFLTTPEAIAEAGAQNDVSDEKIDLLGKAQSLGIAADGRWGLAKLKAAIAEAGKKPVDEPAKEPEVTE